jgi:hypothetical protein
MFGEEREEGDEGWTDRFDNSRIYDEEREEYNRDKPSDSKDKWEEKGLKLEGYSLCFIEAHTIARQDMCDNSPRKIPYYRLNQSTLVIKR